ncbi:uncharacterized protein LOC142616233 [Castanea sativa]|uniref:uncharacterized protein LOC142616233 n=1 Tax=Castanea sativa TaxID=21020 RepID=UPI003F64F2AA
MYNGRTDLVEHANHFNQRMAVHLRNETLMCKVFPSSLGPVAIRWFDRLEEGFVSSFQELTKAFGAQFFTCSRVPHSLDSLLSLAMKEGETLKTYFDMYWKMFNEIDGDFEDVAIRTFKVGLPTEYDLRKSLTRKPTWSMCQLVDRIDEYKWDLGHTTEDCRTLQDYLEQLVKVGKLKQFMYQPLVQGAQARLVHQRENPLRPSLGTINVILAAQSRIGTYLSKVMFVSSSHAEDPCPELE